MLSIKEGNGIWNKEWDGKMHKHPRETVRFTFITL